MSSQPCDFLVIFPQGFEYVNIHAYHLYVGQSSSGQYEHMEVVIWKVMKPENISCNVINLLNLLKI